MSEERVNFVPRTLSSPGLLVEDQPPSQSENARLKQRRPFHYHYGATPPQTSLGSRQGPRDRRSPTPSREEDLIEENPTSQEHHPAFHGASSSEQAMYSRYKYYARLNTNIGVIPHHVVPAPFFAPLVCVPPPGTTVVKQSSFITIFAIWSTMMGTSILSMPWAIHQAGLALGIAIVIAMTGLCLYTAWRVVTLQKTARIPGALLELPALTGYFLGKWAEYATVLFSVFALMGAAIVYWVLLSNFLYHTVSYINTEIKDDGTNSNHSSLPTSLNVICPNVTTPKLLGAEDDPFDRYWTINVTAPLAMIPVLGPLLNFQSPTFFTKFTSLGTLSVVYIVTFIVIKINKWGFLTNVNFSDRSSPHFVPLVQPKSFQVLSGVLALALFIHNCIITIMSQQENPKNNTRDLIIAYFLVSGTYVIVGLLFYLGFPLDKGCIEDNFLNNFVRDDLLSMIARVFLFFQLAAVFPLIVYVIRTQVFFFLYGRLWPSLTKVLMLNLVIVATCVLFAMFLPQIGTVIRFAGAFCGLVLIFTFPPLCYIRACKEIGTASWFKTTCHLMIILFGVTNFVMQFVTAN